MPALGALIGVSLALAVALSVWARRRLDTPRSVAAERSQTMAVSDRHVFWRFSRPYRGPLLVAVVLTLTLVVIDLALPWPLAIVIDHAIGGAALPGPLSALENLTPSALVALAAISTVALTALSGLTMYMVTYLNGGVQARIGADLRSEVFARMQDASLRFHDRIRTGDLLARLSIDVSFVEDMLVAWFETALPEVLTLLGVFTVMVIIDPTLALTALVVLPLLVWWARWAHGAVRSAEMRARSSTGSMLDTAGDSLRHVRAIQVFSRQQQAIETFIAESDEAADSQMAAVERSARLAPFADVVLAAGGAAVLFVGAQRVLTGNLTVGILVVLLTYIAQLYGPIESLSLLVMTMARGAASRDRLVELLDAERAVTDPVEPDEAPSGPVTLCVRNVRFSYGDAQAALQRFSFTARPGEVVSIVGSTGAGKSSLLSLLVRLYDPDSGAIMLNGVDVRRLTVRAVRDRIAFVPQDMWILDGTIAENIAFGRPDATDEEVARAGRAALVNEFVDDLPDGYDSVVGEEGIGLSGGQRRRVALARALIREAPVVILDEPTSGLDADAAAQVWGSIEALRDTRTVLIVTHDLQLASRGDRIYVMESGRNVESGSHRVLLKKNKRYAGLWRSQGPALVGTGGHGAADAVSPPSRGEEGR